LLPAKERLWQTTDQYWISAQTGCSKASPTLQQQTGFIRYFLTAYEMLPIFSIFLSAKQAAAF
jgi:hypothetical protein